LRLRMPRIRLKAREPTIISRADRAQQARQWQLAAGLYRIALERNARNPPIWVQYGHSLKESGNPAEAEVAYRTAIFYNPDDADTHLQLGHILKLQGKREEAQAAYLKAWTINRSLTDAAHELVALGWTQERLYDATDVVIGSPVLNQPLAAAKEPNLPPGFSRDLPTIQNAISIFANWTSIVPIPDINVGSVPLFSPKQDPRPSFLCKVFGSIDQFDILELGSFEGCHSYQLDKLGAKSLLGIEANAESFLKSLIVKETFGLKCRFLHGDFIQYLECTPKNGI
jgi:tetratricopeptide (TPR) repeat protein